MRRPYSGILRLQVSFLIGLPMAFDAYHKWLGIPPREQPPNHYRLLGIPNFEDDGDVIDAAANQRMSYLQQRSGGEHVAISQQLLNQVSQARLCMLNAKSKAAYDAELRTSLAPPIPPPVVSPPPIVSPPPVVSPPPIAQMESQGRLLRQDQVVDYGRRLPTTAFNQPTTRSGTPAIARLAPQVL